MPILGIDEVGRGPWAGPLVIGAVILKHPKTKKELALEVDDATILDPIWDELTDSKKLTKSRREGLAPEIENRAFATGLGWVPAEELDQLGLADALRTAAKRAVENCLKNAGIKNPEKYLDTSQDIAIETDFPVEEIIIDGTSNFLIGTPLESRVTVLKKADLLIKEVSAASIIAKVARDNYMIEIAKKYPEYNFESHVGYGTARHKEALEKYGPCPEHRTSFKPVAKILGLEIKEKSTNKNTTKIGQAAEEVVAEYLRKKGHKILAHNYKTRLYEIDLVSATKDHLYFTEVKYRKNSTHGTPLEFIDKKKKQQMSFAAEAFTLNLAKRLNRDLDSLPSPVLAAASVSGPDFKLEDWLPVV
ncbi:MAG: ribonuclease HII [Candidatus Saccharibacteria bacterium]|nr:ribonuclease HII [Candidatus Saccharibacteria bacterium]